MEKGARLSGQHFRLINSHTHPDIPLSYAIANPDGEEVIFEINYTNNRAGLQHQ